MLLLPLPVWCCGGDGSYIFHEIFSHSLATIDPFEGLTDQDIRTAIYNANGTRPSLFVPEMSFDLLVRKQIARLEQVRIETGFRDSSSHVDIYTLYIC